MPCLYHWNVQRGLPNIYLREVAIFGERFVQKLHSLKIDGWKMKISFWVWRIFRCELLVFREAIQYCKCKITGCKKKQHPPRNLDVQYFLWGDNVGSLAICMWVSWFFVHFLFNIRCHWSLDLPFHTTDVNGPGPRWFPISHDFSPKSFCWKNPNFYFTWAMKKTLVGWVI